MITISGTDDQIATVLIELAQTDTAPRSAELADTIVRAMKSGLDVVHKDARRSAGFGVLKAPDIPSVLIELGFMSDAGDLDNLASAEWRALAAGVIRDGLIAWIEADAILAARRRN